MHKPQCMSDYLVNTWNAAFDHPESRRHYALILAADPKSAITAEYAAWLLTFVAQAPIKERQR